MGFEELERTKITLESLEGEVLVAGKKKTLADERLQQRLLKI
jgi:hypothetical protein